MPGSGVPAATPTPGVPDCVRAAAPEPPARVRGLRRAGRWPCAGALFLLAAPLAMGQVEVAVLSLDVTLPEDPLVVEEGSSRTYSVQPSGRFVRSATIRLTSSSGAATVSPGTLTFTGQTWTTPQTVTVRGAPDTDLDDADVTIGYGVTGFVTANWPTTAVKVIDTGTGTDRVAVSAATLTVDAGGAATYTVRLDNRPGATQTVTVTPRAAGAGAVTVSPRTLTFTAQTWKTPQTVTVRGAPDTDLDLDDARAQVTHAVAGYGGVTTADPVAVTVADTGTGTDRVAVSPTSLALDEGDAATYTVRLDNRPDATVTVTATSTRSRSVAVTPATLTFTARTWKIPQTVTVRAVDDDDFNDEDRLIRHAVAGYGSVTTADPVRVKVTDLDAVLDLSFVPPTLHVDEGQIATYTITLHEPLPTVLGRPQLVYVFATSADLGAVRVDDPGVAFQAPAGQAPPPHVVAVRGEVDADLDDEEVTISHRYLISGAAGQAGVNVTVNVTDTGAGADGVWLSDRTLVFDEGGSATYAVRLDSRPAGTVTVTPSAAGTGAVALAPASLTFDRTTWKTPQTVTVTDVTDTDVSDSVLEIGHAVAGYGAVTAGGTVTVLVFDTGAGAPGVAVTANRTDFSARQPVPLSVDEGGRARYWVRLNSRPAAGETVTVTVQATDPDADPVAVSPRTLTFDAESWRTLRPVTVTGSRDSDRDDGSATISHAVSGYGSVTAGAPVAVTVIDTGVGYDGVTVRKPDVMLFLAEGGRGAYTVLLDSRPGAGKTVTVTATPVTTPIPDFDDEGPVAVSPATLTFDRSNWRTPQTVTVTDEPDADQDHKFVRIHHSVAGYRTVTGAAPVEVAVIDTGVGTPGVSVAPSAQDAQGRLPVDEGGRTTYTVQLDSRPDGEVTVTPTSADRGTVTLWPRTLTFDGEAWGKTSWRTPRTVTVEAAADTDLSDETVAIDHAVSGYGSVTARSLTVAVTDTGTGTNRLIFAPVTGAGIAWTRSQGLRAALDEGRDPSYTVQLANRPETAVTVRMECIWLLPSGLLDRDCAPPLTWVGGARSTALTFDRTTWKAPQTVTVRVPADRDVDDERIRIRHVDGIYGSQTHWAQRGFKDVWVEVADTGVGADGVTLTPPALTVDEGRAATYTVRLDSRPGGTVTVTPASGAPQVAAVAPPALTFDATTWRTPQTVTVTAAADADVDDAALQVSHRVSGYGPVTAAALPVAVTDTGTGSGGMTASQERLSVDEGSSADYTLRLNQRPAGRVAVTLTSGAPGAAPVSPATLSFDATTWRTPQTVTVRGLADPDFDDLSTEIRALVAGEELISTPVTVVDTGTGVVGLVLSPEELDVEESGSATYTVRLGTRPAGPVTVTNHTRLSSPVSAKPPALTFDRTTWKTPQTVTVTTGVLEDSEERPQVSTWIRLCTNGYGTSLPDPETGSTTIRYPCGGPTLAAVLKVNQVGTGTGTYGVALSTQALTVDEGGSATYTVRLDTRPAVAAVLTPTSGDPGAVAVAPQTLTFDHDNWRAAQTVTVRGVADADGDAEEVRITNPLTGYGSVLGTAPITVTVTDPEGRIADLSGLELSAGALTPAFSPTTARYRTEVEHAVASVTVTPTAGPGSAAIRVNGAPVAVGAPSQPIALRAGASTTILVWVRAKHGGATKTYIVAVYRKTSAALSGLELVRVAPGFANLAATLEPPFAGGVTTYRANVASSVQSVQVTPTAADPHPRVEITVNGSAITSGASRTLALSGSDEAVTVAVTAADKRTTRTYTVRLDRQPASRDAGLSDVTVEAGAFTRTIGFSSRPVHGVRLPHDAARVTITPRTRHPYATVAMRNREGRAGTALSNPVDVPYGTRRVHMAVTAEAGNTKRYVLLLTRPWPSNDADLSGLALSAGELAPKFDSATLSYTATVPYPARVTITPTAAQRAARRERRREPHGAGGGHRGERRAADLPGDGYPRAAGVARVGDSEPAGSGADRRPLE